MKISNNFNPPIKPHLQFSAASFLRKKSNGEKTQKTQIKKTNFHPCPHKIALQQAREEKFFNSFLEKEGKVSLAEYQEIVKHHPSTISRSYFMCSENKTLGITPKSTAKMAIALKDYYDKKYKNYKIISIGTSPAVITETMQNLGADVLFLPISHLHQIGDTKLHPLRSKYPTISSRFPNIKTLMNYCTKKGISKDKNKEIILLDFTSQGKTLNIVNEIIAEREDIPREKIHKHSIIDDYKKIIANEESQITWELVRHLQNDMARSCVSEICNVPHFPFFDDDEMYKDAKNTIHSKNSFSFQIFQKFDNFSTPKGRAWALCSTHEAMKLLGQYQ